MAKILLANGCSHVAGSESALSFATPLAEKLGMSAVNIALPGGSNDRINRTTIDFCLNNQVDFVVIGWTTHERFEFPWNNTTEYYGLGRQSTDARLQKLFDYMSLYCSNWNPVGLSRALHSMYSLQCFLESKQIPYLFFNSWNHIPVGYQDTVWNNINKDKYYKPHEGIFENFERLMPDNFSAMRHGNETVHLSIAEELYEQAIRRRVES
jgi:hypothetical protein